MDWRLCGRECGHRLNYFKEYQRHLAADFDYSVRIATATFTVGESLGTTGKSDCLFNWAESTYPSLFAPRGLQSATYAPYYVRYYSTTTAYLAVTSTSPVYLGPLSGNQLADLGAVSFWYATAG